MEQREEEAVVSMTKGEFSSFPPQNDGIRYALVCSIGRLLQPPAPCAKSLLLPRKGREQK